MPVENQSTPATEAAITAATDKIIASTCQKHGITAADLPTGAVEDARRAAKEMVESDARKESNEFYHLYISEKAARESAEATLKAVRENRGVAANTEGHRHSVTAERARDLMGRNQWFNLTDSQKIAAVDVDPNSVERQQLKDLFGKGHDTHFAVDFSKANP